MIIAGAGGVGRETLDACAVAGLAVSAFVDDARSGESLAGLPVVDVDAVSPTETFVVAVGSTSGRRTLAARLAARGLEPAQVVHPRAVVSSGTDLGPGAIVFGGAHVSIDVSAGLHLQVHYNATVGHDCVAGDFVTVLPGANVSGSVRLEGGVTIGSGAVVLPGLTVGRDAFVGAGAVVVRDVAPGTVVVGCPARPLEQTRP